MTMKHGVCKGMNGYQDGKLWFSTNRNLCL